MKRFFTDGQKTGILAGTGFILFMIVVFIALHFEERNEFNQMQVCVAAGKEWRRDFGNYYECIEP